MKKIFYFFRLHVKLFLRNYVLDYTPWRLNSFCKKCGRNVVDFSVDDDIWDNVEKHIKYGYTLCFDCFVGICLSEGIADKFDVKVIKKEGNNYV